mgnify:CR=1 FL=1
MIDLLKGDCLIESDKIESGSVDLILTDLPYGNMNTDGGRKLGINGWDLAIEPKKVYEIANRILRKNGKMVLFSQEPYTTKLITEAIPNMPFSYRATWEKDNFAVALGAKVNMVSFTEDVLVFSKNYDFEGLHPLRNYFKNLLSFIGLKKKYIIEKGGYIFFLLENTEIIGTIALMKKKEMIYELTKMAIVPEKRGKKMGQYLMDYCIEFAKNKNLIKLVLYSNTLLENAIHIYLKKGFKKIPVEKNCPYKRSNIKMELLLVDKN